MTAIEDQLAELRHTPEYTPTVIAWSVFFWDCGCDSINEVGHDPTGETLNCSVCGLPSRIGGVA